MRLILLTILLALASIAQAADLQPRQSGQWYDPAFNGQGVVLSVYEQAGVNRVNVLLFAGGDTWIGRPFWLVGNAPVDSAAAFDLLEVYAAFGLPDQGVPPRIAGAISLTATACNRITADIAVDNVTAVTWHLQPLLFDQGAGC